MAYKQHRFIACQQTQCGEGPPPIRRGLSSHCSARGRAGTSHGTHPIDTGSTLPSMSQRLPPLKIITLGVRFQHKNSGGRKVQSMAPAWVQEDPGPPDGTGNWRELQEPRARRGRKTPVSTARKGEACLLAAQEAGQRCQTTGGFCLAQGQKLLRQRGMVALSRGLGPGSGFDSWLCHFLAGWPWQVTSLVPLLYGVDRRTKCKLRAG